MNTTIVPLEECFPNPDATYLARGTEEVRGRGDAEGMDARLRALAEVGARAWFAGLKEWTDVPDDVLGTWVRNARHEVRWASLSDITARADGIDEAYSRSAGWVRVRREAIEIDPQYVGRSTDFLAWRARHADTARVEWDPKQRRDSFDWLPEVEAFTSIAACLSSESIHEATAAISDVVREYRGTGHYTRSGMLRNNQITTLMHGVMAEAGIVESIAYLLDRGNIPILPSLVKSLSIVWYSDVCQLGDYHYEAFFSYGMDQTPSVVRRRVFSDIVTEALLSRLRGDDTDRDVSLHILRSVGPRLRSMSTTDRSRWASVLFNKPLGSEHHVELGLAFCAPQLRRARRNDPSGRETEDNPPMAHELTSPSAETVQTVRNLLSGYIALDRSCREANLNDCLATSDLRCHYYYAVSGLVHACSLSERLRVELSMFSRPLKQMIDGWAAIRDNAYPNEEEPMRKLRWAGSLMCGVFADLVAALTTCEHPS